MEFAFLRKAMCISFFSSVRSSGNAYSVRNANPPPGAVSCRSQQMQYSSTSPMAVPISMHRVQENRANSPACGR